MRTGVVALPSTFHPNRRELVKPVAIDPRGVIGPTPGQTRGPRWRRSSHGMFVPSWVDPTVVEQRIVEASAASPPYGAVAGWAALRWLGGRWFAGTRSDGSPLPVTLAATGIRPQPGISVSEERLNAYEIVAHDRLVITSALHSALSR